MEKQRVVESFEREKIPPPHAVNEDGSSVHCKTTKANAVCYLECQCGYSGIAHVLDGEPVCPAHLARVEQQKRENSRTLDTSANAPNIEAFIAAAVQKALAQKGGN